MFAHFGGKQNAKDFSWLCVLYVMFYFAQYPIFSFLAVYLKGLEFSNVQVGILTSVGPVVTIFAQNFWGTVADRAKTKNRVLMIVIIGTGIASLFLQIHSIHRYFIVMILILAALYFFFLSIQSLSETVTLEVASRERMNYGIIRGLGSFGFALTGFIFSFFPDLTIEQMFTIFTIASFAVIIPALFIPKTKGHQSEKEGKKTNFFVLFKYKDLMLVIVFVFLVYVCMNYAITFYPVYFTSDMGLTKDVYSRYMSIGVFIQAFMMFIAPKVFKKINLYKLFLIGGGLTSIRMFLSVFATGPYTIFFTFLTMSVAAVFFLYSGVLFINNTVPPELKASGQSLWLVTILGLSPVFGNIIGGALSQLLGSLANGFIFFGVVCAVIVILFAILFRGKKAYL